MKKKNKKVIIAMSGGVDSSVAAAILKNQGYDVIGVFMKFWKQSGKTQENKCCSAEAQADARKVAAELNIPFYVIDARKEFKKRVVDYFINEHKIGRTPNPCVECNRWIKFGFLMEKILELKVDYIATGHYVRLRRIGRRPTSLLVAKDKTKDQSYFLWTLKQQHLKKILFPIGNYNKDEIRKMAKRFDLPVFNKKDSQEICFIHKSVEDFLKKQIKTKAGDIITINNKKVGEHEGLAFYTIGQRKGIKIGGIGPFYVVEKDLKNNALIVGKSEHVPELYKKEMIVEKVNWISKPTKFPFKCKIKIRYLHPANPATIEKSGKNLKVIFNKKQRAITSGQSAVFYLKNEILGGGIIV